MMKQKISIGNPAGTEIGFPNAELHFPPCCFRRHMKNRRTTKKEKIKGSERQPSEGKQTKVTSKTGPTMQKKGFD